MKLGSGFPKTPATARTPVTPAAPKAKPAGWCIPNSGVSDAQMQANLGYACGQGIDYSPIQPGGACYEPNTFVSHTAYAMNLLYQTAGWNPWNYDFSQAAAITSTNPSGGICSDEQRRRERTDLQR
ncbi:glucan endo-1,3-beta-D-glucosidase-like [Macadamia integrifolia]|uniref:glucan endo-1,3-beta-D-glucosidase-like n=1 Tax=Macadamia integrifolia TaxID=60698 RepID=UPI001C4EC3B5|nr:glucan endo-1,3-beta-D-glucosidase-like [Macadamia integrifolia]